MLPPLIFALAITLALALTLAFALQVLLSAYEELCAALVPVLTSTNEEGMVEAARALG